MKLIFCVYMYYFKHITLCNTVSRIIIRRPRHSVSISYMNVFLQQEILVTEFIYLVHLLLKIKRLLLFVLKSLVTVRGINLKLMATILHLNNM